jgi:hypothetical protein
MTHLVKPALSAFARSLGLLALLAWSDASAQSPAVPSLTQTPPPIPAGRVTVSAAAFFANGLQPIRSGLVWRIYEDRGDALQPAIVNRSASPTPTFNLPPGNYIMHAAYGFASASKRLSIQAGAVSERLTISAGALKLKGAVGDSPIPPNRLSFTVYVPMPQNSEGRLIVANAKANDIIRLPEGTYHVVSTYGDANAIMRSDLKVESGRVTEATLNHRAATVTLKLVGTAGGEAFAGTAFSVLTPGGDVIREAIGAFPSVTLAEGDYVLIARHEGKVFTREFKVESGLDRDVEIVVPPT